MSWITFLIYISLYSQALATEDLPAIVKKIGQSVVVVQTYDKEGSSLGQGSGFFINEMGNVITNRHVLEGADRAEIKTADGKVYLVKEILAEDKEGDLILISVAITLKAVHPLSVSASLPEVGERVVVIGNPLGLEQTVSDGIVSAVREIPSFGKVVQITAPISPGSSGSPVVNMKGEVIAVATFQAVKGQNLNFSIPGKRVADLTPGKGIILAEWEEGRKKEWLDSAEEIYSKGLPFVWAEKYEDALPYFEEAVKRNPRYAEAHFQIGYCNLFLLRYEDAIRAFTQVIQIKRDYTVVAVVYTNRGLAYYNKGQYDQAIKDYNKAIEIDPGNAVAYINRGFAYRNKGQYDQAIKDYTKAIEIDPGNADAYYNRGFTYLMNLGDKIMGCADWKKACELGQCRNYNILKQKGDCR